MREKPELPRAEPTLWLQTILVPVDFSADSVAALQYAAAMARDFHAKVLLLHVTELNVAGEERGIPRTQFLNAMGRAAERRLRELARTVWPSGIETEVLVRSGRPHEEIVNAARETDADIIILSDGKQSGLLRLLRPRTAQRVIRHAPCPVLMLRPIQHPFVLQLPPKTMSPIA